MLKKTKAPSCQQPTIQILDNLSCAFLGTPNVDIIIRLDKPWKRGLLGNDKTLQVIDDVAWESQESRILRDRLAASKWRYIKAMQVLS